MTATPNKGNHTLCAGPYPSSKEIWWQDSPNMCPPCAIWNTQYTWAATQVDGKWGMPCHLRGELKPPTSIKPKWPLWINNPVTPFSNTLDYLPTQKHIQELCFKITPKIIFLLWSTSHQLEINKFKIQLNRSCIIKINLLNLKMFYHDAYQLIYSSDRNSTKPWCQYKPIDVFKLFCPIIALPQWVNNPFPFGHWFFSNTHSKFQPLNWWSLTVKKKTGTYHFHARHHPHYHCQLQVPIHPSHLSVFGHPLFRIHKGYQSQTPDQETPFQPALPPLWCLSLERRLTLLKLESANWQNGDKGRVSMTSCMPLILKHIETSDACSLLFYADLAYNLIL